MPWPFVIPRTVVAEEESVEVLTAPLQFFVEVGSFTAMSGKPPQESELKYKKFNGVTKAGVPFLKRQFLCYCVVVRKSNVLNCVT